MRPPAPVCGSTQTSLCSLGCRLPPTGGLRGLTHTSVLVYLKRNSACRGELIERPAAVATHSRWRSRGPVVCSTLEACVRLVDQMQRAANVSVFHPPLFVITPAAVRPNDLLTKPRTRRSAYERGRTPRRSQVPQQCPMILHIN